MLDKRLGLSFDIVGLPLREAILLKSFMRMMDNRTHQQWVYRNSPESQAPVLTFLADETPLGDATTPVVEHGRKMRLGVLDLGVVGLQDHEGGEHPHGAPAEGGNDGVHLRQLGRQVHAGDEVRVRGACRWREKKWN